MALNLHYLVLTFRQMMLEEREKDRMRLLMQAQADQARHLADIYRKFPIHCYFPQTVSLFVIGCEYFFRKVS